MRLVVMTDGQHAPNAIAQGYSTGSKQALIARIIRSIRLLDTREDHVNLRLIPAHAGVEGNEQADKAAKAMKN
jgi:ribonuclease HI